MFTTPDQSDAVTVAPAFSPPGPNPEGFFADCNPAQNFAGTRPIADYFNELIVNLRALLTKGGIAAVKGDATMLWRAILGLTRIATAVTLNVTPAGTATPVNPFGGDPFNSLAAALNFLADYRITPKGSVTIQIAAGTYTQAGQLVFSHPDGIHITINGAGMATTTLIFTGSSAGLVCTTTLLRLANLTLQGDATATVTATPAMGLFVGSAAVNLSAVKITQFGGGGIVMSRGYCGVDAGGVTLLGNYGPGLQAGELSVVDASTTGAVITATNNTGPANVWVDGSYVTADSIQCAGGTLGLLVVGPGAEVMAHKLGVDACSNPAAIQVSNGAALTAWSSAVAGDWWTWKVSANQPQNFSANYYGLMRTEVALASNNRSNCSPAINTLGNTQAYIQAI